ncbi:MAG: SUMF1/EgtB/PvdO family nonheme iron enzyme [Gemmataceae bacterium]
MTDRDALLAAVARDPADGLAWLALGDALEEAGDQPAAELLRLTRRLLGLGRDAPERGEVQTRVNELLASGVRPCVPGFTNAVGMRFVLIPPAASRRPFWLGDATVTQGEYDRVMAANPSHHAGPPTLPVDSVDLVAMDDFVRRLEALTGEAGAYRLPTEDEWEYACRAGTTTEFHVGTRLSSAQANCRPEEAGQRQRSTVPVRTFAPNAFGLYDMHGNVYELCHGTAPGPDLVAKGGSCQMRPEACASSTGLDVSWATDGGANDLGFRVLREWR